MPQIQDYLSCLQIQGSGAHQHHVSATAFYLLWSPRALPQVHACTLMYPRGHAAIQSNFGLSVCHVAGQPLQNQTRGSRGRVQSSALSHLCRTCPAPSQTHTHTHFLPSYFEPVYHFSGLLQPAAQKVNHILGYILGQQVEGVNSAPLQQVLQLNYPYIHICQDVLFDF